MSSDADLCHLSIDQAQGLIARRELSPVELTKAHLRRIEALDGHLHAFIKLTAGNALAEAEAAEAEIAATGSRGPLHGIPVAIKDQYDFAGAPALVRIPPPETSEDAGAVSKLREAGAVVLGKLAMSGLPGAHPEPRNPWDIERTPGGSSSGSGAAIAAGLCMGSLGEDTAGSIRNPASCCAIVGLKPTYGRVSRRGLATLGWSLDHSGPITRTVEDAAHVLGAIAGQDPRDHTTSSAPVAAYAAALGKDIEGLVVGVPQNYLDALSPRLNDEIAAGFNAMLREMEALGARVEQVNVPSMEHASIATGVLYCCEYLSGRNLGLQHHVDIASDTRRARVYFGALTGAAEYLQAQRLRQRLRRELAAAFQQVDILALPGHLQPAGLIEEMTPLESLRTQLSPDFNAPFNLSGSPAMTLPCGFTNAGLPIAFQLVGRAFDEATVLRVGHAYQQHAAWPTRPPDIQATA